MGTSIRFSRAALFGSVAVAVALAVVGTAWACTPSATLNASPGEGRPGSTVNVEGDQFTGTVEIRWSAGDRLLARTSGPSFSVAVQIPSDAAPGTTYYIVATGTLADGTQAGMNRAPFYIPATGESTSTSSGSSGQRRTSGTVTGGSRSSEPQAGSTDASSNPNADATPSPVAPETASGTPAPAEAGVAPRAPGRASGSPAPAVERRASVATAGGSPAPSGGNGVSVDAPAGPVPASDEQEPEPAPAVLQSGRTVGSDVWSGFRSGSDAVRGPGLDTSSSTGSDGGAPSGAGIALLSVGLFALAVGAGVAVTRRKAVPVRRPEAQRRN